MKRSQSLVALALCVFVVVGCTKVATPGVGGRNPWTIPGVLRIGNSDEPDNLNPLFHHTAAGDQIDGLLYSNFLRYDDNGNYIPDLATAVPTYANGGLSKDNLTVTVHMRKGVRWADGQPLTSADWMFTYSAVRNPRNNVKSTFGWDDIASAAAPDPYTIVIHLKKPDASILGSLAFGGSGYPPLPAHLLAKLPDLNRADFNSHPLSSGPFILQQWNHGASLIFVPNPHYFRGTPKLQRIEWKVVPDDNTLFSQLQTHEIDVVTGVNENHVANLGDIAGITVTKKLIANWRHMGINMSKPLLRDRRVRLAIAEAVDWPRINDTIYHGYNQLAVSDVFPKLWAAPDIPHYRYDPQDAKRVLAQAGWTPGPDGTLRNGPDEMRLTISTGTNKQENQQAEVQIQSDLRSVGIDIQIRNYPVSLLFAQNGPLYGGKYDLEWSVDTNGPDPDNSCLWASDCIPPHGANTSWLRDAIVDRTSHAAAGTFDRAQRKRLYQQEEQRIHELVPAVFFYWENEYVAANSDLRNYRPAAFVQDTWNAWQWQI